METSWLIDIKQISVGQKGSETSSQLDPPLMQFWLLLSKGCFGVQSPRKTLNKYKAKQRRNSIKQYAWLFLIQPPLGALNSDRQDLDLLSTLQLRDKLPESHLSHQKCLGPWLVQGHSPHLLSLPWHVPIYFGTFRYSQLLLRSFSLVHTLYCRQRPVATEMTADGISLYWGYWPAHCLFAQADCCPPSGRESYCSQVLLQAGLLAPTEKKIKLN